VDGLASSDAHKASLVLWNRTDQEQSVHAELEGIPFAKGNFSLYRIDDGHASFFDGAAENLAATESRAEVKTSHLAWSGKLPGRGVVYMTVGDGTAQDFQSQPRTRRLADVVRVDYCYEKRGTSNYAWFDRKAWTAYLGMGNERAARSLVAVTAEALPDVLVVFTAVEGPVRHADPDSLLALRLDFGVGDTYAKAVLFHGGAYHAQQDLTVPWGTKGRPDSAVKVADLSRFEINLAAHAPPGWNGRVMVSFEMRNTGIGTRARIALAKR
jgi:hypothetical protein